MVDFILYWNWQKLQMLFNWLSMAFEMTLEIENKENGLFQMSSLHCFWQKRKQRIAKKVQMHCFPCAVFWNLFKGINYSKPACILHTACDDSNKWLWALYRMQVSNKDLFCLLNHINSILQNIFFFSMNNCPIYQVTFYLLSSLIQNFIRFGS